MASETIATSKPSSMRSHVRLDAEVGGHAGDDDFADAGLSELEGEVVGFGTVDLVGLTTMVLPSLI